MDKKCMKKLKALIEDVVMPDIEDHIDDIFEEIASSKNASEEDNNDLKEMHEMRDEFQEILKEIDNNELEAEECSELLEEINIMLKEQEELED